MKKIPADADCTGFSQRVQPPTATSFSSPPLLFQIFCSGSPQMEATCLATSGGFESWRTAEFVLFPPYFPTPEGSDQRQSDLHLKKPVQRFLKSMPLVGFKMARGERELGGAPWKTHLEEHPRRMPREPIARPVQTTSSNLVHHIDATPIAATHIALISCIAFDFPYFVGSSL